MHKRNLWPTLTAAIAGYLAVAAVAQTAQQPASMPAGAGPYEAYGGSASCAECHPTAYKDWQGSHHARAQRGIVAAIDQEAFEPQRVIPHGTEVSFAGINDGQYTLTTTGGDANKHPYVPTGVIGVFPLWQYLIPTEGGRLQVTELAFDPSKKEWFNVYGDEDRKPWEWGHWSNRGMNWNNMCAACHTTGFGKGYDADTDAYRSTFIEEGVGCEQCHGPMRDHVEWQREYGGPAEPKIDEPAVTTRAKDPTLRVFDRQTYLSVCGSCHARRADLTGQFLPGERFDEHYDLVLPDMSDIYYPDGQVHEEDFEFAAFSLSYMQNWGVRCTDCHFWHTGKVAKQDNSLCLRCHERGISTRRAIDEVEHSHHPRDKGGSLCIDCHMPITNYMQRHPRHDHGMTIPDPLLTKEHGIPNACTRCHADQTVEWSIDYVQQWYGERMERPTRERARVLARLKESNFNAVPQVIALSGQETNPAWRAVYARFLGGALGRIEEQEPARKMMDALTGLLDDPVPLVQATAIEGLEPVRDLRKDRIAAKLDSPSRLVRIRAAWAMRAELDPASKAWQDIDAFLKFNRDQPLGAFQYANLMADRNQIAEALPWYERAIRWDGATAVFRHSYAVVLHGLARSEEAVEQLRKACEIDRREAAYPYALGLLYAEMGKLPEAATALQNAVDLAPTQGRLWYNLALALDQLGDHQRAIEDLRKAEQLDSHTADYSFARATIHLKLGEMAQAREALERTLDIDPRHPQARALLGLP